mmetsp:Transcript_3141/g.4861  ORF Transcript_3141/g.4861 Transcript_3141/m.4861 type:complete len:315 (+) Transcript_3141:84-1028(+)
MSETTQWVKKLSSKHNTHYWFNTTSGESRWEPPEDVRESKKPRIEKPEEAPSTREEEVKSESSNIDVAIIVPFRDIHSEQRRSEHLARFIPEMTAFLQKSRSNCHIYIIEQSTDERRFNRGKLLNIGFDIARKKGCQIFVFHDVDLLPSSDLLHYYITLPTPGPVHIARVWERYSRNPDYFGGIVAFSRDQFETINGFPNNFWGWGGEDDEMIKRVRECNMKTSSPNEGSIEDMEGMNLNEKLQFLRQHRDWKCQKKWEVLEEHARTWRSNGLSDLCYNVVDTVDMNSMCTKVTVDIKLNGHWTDGECKFRTDR